MVAPPQLRPPPGINPDWSKEQLWEIITEERADAERLRAALRLSDNILAVKTDTLKPGHKVTRLALEKELTRHTPDAGGWIKIDTWAIEKDSDTDVATVRKHLTYFKKLGIIDKRTVRIDLGKNPVTGKKEYTTDYYVKKQAYFQQPLAYHPPEEVRKQGRARDGAGRGHKRHCQHCGGEQGDAYNIFYCYKCKQWSHEVVNESPEIQVELADPDGTRALVIQEEEEAAIETIKLSPSPTPPHREIQLEFADSEQDEGPITARLAPLDWRPTITAWLEKRIGEHIAGEKRIIAATGKLEYRQKYYYKDEDYIPDIARYLAGDPEHVYGSRVYTADGFTWLLCYDIDQKHLDERHIEFMTRLAAAGVASLYFQRRPGRGHLEIHFTSLIDALAAHQWILSIVPELAGCEWFPHGKQPLSWPLWQRIGSEVTECATEAMHPDRLDCMDCCKGVRSESKKLAELIRRCVTDASLVLPRKVEQTQPQGGRLLDTSSPTRKRRYSGWQVDLIEEFNRSHSWHDVASWCGGFDGRGYFRATWRPGNGGGMGERTPSVKPDGPDSRYCCDYGDGYHKYDKYGIWCKVKGIDAHDDLKARREDLRKEVAA